jgi:hypothetical protein
MENCLVFLARGVMFLNVPGDNRRLGFNKTGYAYAMRNEEWLGLGQGAVIVVMEEGDMQGICLREQMRLEQQAERQVDQAAEVEVRRRRPWNRTIAKLRRRNRSPSPVRVECKQQ